MKLENIILLFLLIIHSQVKAQLTNDSLSRKQMRETEKNKAPEKGDIYLLITPTIGYNPSYGFIYGGGATMSAYLGDPKTTNISSALVGANYTTLNQLILNIRSNVFTQDNQWMLSGDLRYMDSSQPTFGLGTGPQTSKLANNGFEIDEDLFSAPIEEEQQMSYKLIRVYQTAMRKVKSNLYAGLGYHLDIFTDIKDELVDLNSTPPVITSHFAYNNKYGFNQQKTVLSGISLNTTFDNRDNQNKAYRGNYAFLSYRVNPKFIGSDKNSSTLWMEYRTYFDLTHNHKNMLCFWGIGNFTLNGNLPYMNLPAIGWDQFGRTGRGYNQGRFRGEQMIYGEAEWRKHILGTSKLPDLLGIVVFSNFTTATNSNADIRLFRYIDPAFGAGVNIMLLRKARTCIGLDYGIGSYGSSGFYIRLNEAF